MHTTFLRRVTFTKYILIFWFINSAFLITTLFIQKIERQKEKKAKPILYAEISEAPNSTPVVKKKATLKIPKELALQKSTKLATGIGTKSVLFDTKKDFLYAMNLESMSIKVFKRAEKTPFRTLKFKATKAQGFDYQEKKWFSSFAEKPVEACLSHNDRYLWVSLHNAGGVIFWDLKKPQQATENKVVAAKITNHEMDTAYQVSLPFIETGKTPKFIVTAPNNNYVFVSNWHDHNVSVIDTRDTNPNNWKVIKNLETKGVPRGMTLSLDGKSLFVAHMGNGFISVFDIPSLELKQKKYVGATPRHLLADKNFLYVTLSSPEKIVKLSIDSLVQQKSTKTLDDPRTMSFTNDSSMIVTTCYADDQIQVFGKDSLNLLGSWESKGKPVGVDVFQQDSIIEAWVCNYINGNIKVFTFKANFEELPLASIKE